MSLPIVFIARTTTRKDARELARALESYVCRGVVLEIVETTAFGVTEPFQGRVWRDSSQIQQDFTFGTDFANTCYARLKIKLAILMRIRGETVTSSDRDVTSLAGPGAHGLSAITNDIRPISSNSYAAVVGLGASRMASITLWSL
jgi:hypothetical protein